MSADIKGPGGPKIRGSSVQGKKMCLPAPLGLKGGRRAWYAIKGEKVTRETSESNMTMPRTCKLYEKSHGRQAFSELVPGGEEGESEKLRVNFAKEPKS